MKNVNELTTGEMAKICGVSKHTLFHYDETDTFKPTIVKENGYRYYTLDQIEVLQMILILRDIDTPLKEIKEYMKIKTPEKLVNLLEEKESYLQREIKRLKNSRFMIARKIEDTKKAHEIDLEQVYVEEQEKEYLMTLSADNTDYKAAAEAFTNVVVRCHEMGIAIDYSWGSTFRNSDMKEQKYFCYEYYYTKIQSGYGKKYISKNHSLILPKAKGRYLVYYYKDYKWNNEKSYKALCDYACANKIQLEERFYEDVLLDELCVNGYENFITKVSVQIMKS